MYIQVILNVNQEENGWAINSLDILKFEQCELLSYIVNLNYSKDGVR